MMRKSAKSDDGAPGTKEERKLRAMNLTQLGRNFGTDKAGLHGYTQHYETHFSRFRDEEITMLEIGIGGAKREGKGGASLRMWKWFFNKASIVGLDIEDKAFVREPGIITYQGSQADETFLNKVNDEQGPFHVIIDDGSHYSEHVRESFRVLFPLLADGGVYAIEDTQTSYWPDWGGSLDRSDPTTMMNLVKDLVDGLNHVEYLDKDYVPTYSDLNVVAVHCYHNLVFIEKGRNEGRTNKNRIHRKPKGREL